MRGISPLATAVLSLLIVAMVALIAHKFFTSVFITSTSASHRAFSKTLEEIAPSIDIVRVEYTKKIPLQAFGIKPVLYYSFEKINGSYVIDESGNGRNGKIVDIPCYYNKSFWSGHWYEYIGKGCDYISIYAEKYPSWEIAKLICEKRGGYLVVISSAEENSFVRSLGPESIFIGYYQDPDDLTDNNGIPEGCPGNEPSGCWKWVDNPVGETSSYTNWASGQPDNSGAQHVARMKEDGKWDDYHSNARLAFVCEYTQDPGRFLTYDAAPEITDGIDGKAMEFDGFDDYIEISSLPFGENKGNNTKVTIEIWSAPDKKSVRQIVFSDSWQEIGFHITNAFVVRAVLQGAILPGVSLNESQWIFMSLIYDNETGVARFLVNGKEVGNATRDPSTTEFNDPPFAIGCDKGWVHDNYEGRIDEVRIWNTNLSKEDVYAHWVGSLIVDLYSKTNFTLPEKIYIDLKRYGGTYRCNGYLTRNKSFWEIHSEKGSKTIAILFGYLNCTPLQSGTYSLCFILKGRQICEDFFIS